MKFYADFLIGGKVLSYEVGARDFPEASSVVFAFLAGVRFYETGLSFQKTMELIGLSAKPTRGRKYLSLYQEEFKK